MWLSPISLLLGAPLVWVVVRSRLNRWGHGLLTGLFAAGLFFSTPLAANLQLGWLERPVPADSLLCSEFLNQDIVLLTAGFSRKAVDVHDHAALSQDSLRRVLAAVQLQREHPASRLLIVGGGQQDIAESTVAASLAGQLGIPASRIAVETRSRSTWENAQEASHWHPPLSQPISLVTSAIHMRRAAAAFKAHGIAVCPQVSDRRYVPSDSLGALWPQASAITKTETVWHEWLGSMVYAWRTQGDNQPQTSEPSR